MKRDEGENKNLKNTNVVKTDFFNKKRCVLVLFVLFVVIAVFVAVKIKVIQSSESQSNKSAYGAEEALTINYDELEEKDQYADEGKHIKFAPFFMKDIRDDDYSEKIKGTCNEIGKSAPMLIEIGVESGGTLEDGVITIGSQNFRYQMSSVADSILKKNYISKDVKKIELNDMTSGSQTILMGDIFASITNKDDYSRDNSITLTGTWVADDGEKIDIKKTIDLKVDWYGTATTSISASNSSIILSELEESDPKTVVFDFTVNETKGKLLPKQNVVDIEIPKMFDCEPQVECKNPGVIANYEGGTLHIERNSNSRNNKYTIELTYPENAYDQLYGGYRLTIPIKGGYYCYNNKQYEGNNDEESDETVGIYKTNIAEGTKIITFREASAKSADYDLSVNISSKVFTTTPSNTYSISKQSILNAYDGNKESEDMMYTVMWGVMKTSSPTKGAAGIIMEEPDTDNRHGDNWDNYNMSEYVKNTKVFFSQQGFVTGNGYVKVFDDDTNTLIKEFTPEEINKYNSSERSFTYDAPIKHIRIETNEAEHASGSYLNIYNIKEVDIEAIKGKFSKEEIAGMETLRTDLKGTSTDGALIELYSECKLAVEKSYASVSVSKNELSAVETEPEEQKISITVPAKNVSYADWKDGEFLVAFETSKQEESPIAYLQVDDVNINNGETVEISGYEVVNENGKYFIKIVTKNETPVSGFTINIDCKMLVNPMISSSNINVNLYSYNPYYNIYHYETQDIYDVNDNEETQEDTVGLSSAIINVLSASSFLTVETISDYNNGGEFVIGPNIAEVVKKDNGDGDKEATAKINVSLLNRYERGKVSNVRILGRVPYENNKYIDKDEALGSEFTATIKEGIQVPKELEGSIKVYYTTNDELVKEESVKNIQGLSKEWVEEKDIQDFSNIKAYLIVIDTEELPVKKEYKFSYTISIPDSIPLNSVSYGCHKVYYDFQLDDNKVPMNLQPNKVGLRLVKYYDFDVMKIKENTEHPVQGAKYKLTEIDEDDVNGAIAGTLEETGDEISRIITSNSEGSLVSKDLRVNQIYSFKEIQAPSAYELNDKIIVFKIVENSAGEDELKCVFLPENGEQENENNRFDEEVIMKKETGGKYILTSKVEDTPKFTLNITKQDKSTGEGMAMVIIDVNGERDVTDNEGKAKIENLSIGKEYTLNEVYAKGYYLLKDIKFRLEETSEGIYSIQCTDNKYSEDCKFETNINSNGDSDLIQVNVTLKNEKIPTYNLKIKKVDESDNDTTLKDATFLLTRTDLENSESFTTGEDGTVEIPDMYAFVEGKEGVTGEYTLKETAAPDGYVNNREEVKFYVQKKEGATSAVDGDTGETDAIDSEVTGDEETGADDETEEDDGTAKSEEKYEVKFGSNSEQKEQKDYQTVKNVEIDGDTIIITIQDKPMFKLTKIDEDTEAPLANTGFIIYELKDDGTINYGDDNSEPGFAKDVNGNYVGTKQENGKYVVTTDEKGEIILALGPGNYKAVETGFPEGYEQTPHSEVFIVNGDEREKEEEESGIVVPNIDFTGLTYDEIEEGIEGEEIKIEKIEDLVDLSMGIKYSKTEYYNKKVKLECDLDFENEESYRKPHEKYKFKGIEYTDGAEGEDINGDGNVESIYEELTKKDGNGFTPIGCNAGGMPFSGIFDGQNHKIKNIYINSKNNDFAGLFGSIYNAVIKNITVTGNINADKGDTGGICSNTRGNALFENCSNECTINGGNYTGGILGGAQYCNKLSFISCTNSGDIIGKADVGGIIGYASGSFRSQDLTVNIKNSSNIGKIEGTFAAGICSYIQECSGIFIENVSNSGTVNGIYQAAGIVAYADNVFGIEISNAVNNKTGSIESSSNNCIATGGIAGEIEADSFIIIKNSKNEATVDGCDMIGGIIGYNPIDWDNKSFMLCLIECSNTGNISNNHDSNSSMHSGGLIGYTGGSYTGLCNIKSSYNTGDVLLTQAKGWNGGGLVGGCGTAMVNLEDSYNTGKVQRNQSNGGLIGSCQAISINNCDNYGSIEGDEYVGGLCGRISEGAKIKNSHNLGNIKTSVTGNDAYHSDSYAGGVSGMVSGGNFEGCSNSGEITVEGDLESANFGGIIGNSSSGAIFTKCSNSGNIKVGNCGEQSYVGGIAGICGGQYANCYNSGNIDVEYTNEFGGGMYIGGILGECYSGGIIQYSYNTGNMNFSGCASCVYVGGIEGGGSVTVQKSYNEGNINSNIDDKDFNSQIYIGGLAGYCSTSIMNCYNIGEVINNEESSHDTHVGGIAGGANAIQYTYNASEVYNNIENPDGSIGTGPICGQFNSGGSNNYYPNGLQVVGQNNGTNVGDQKFCTQYSEDDMKTEEFVETLKTGSGPWMYIEDEYPILDIAVLNDMCEATEITVENKKKEYDITAQIAKNVSGNREGGEISIDSENTSDKYMKISNGDVTYVETVEHGKSNTVAIEMTPSEGYAIQKITLNGKDMEFSIDSEGKCNIPADHFKNITTDLHIEVYFAESNKLLTINKKDGNGNKLAGAKFKIESDKFTRDDMVERINTNDSYTFSENESGELIPNNIGIKDSTAHSCYMIDLEGETGDCAVEIDASFTGPGKLCAAITESEEVPTTYNKEESDCVFMNESSFGSNGTFISDCLTAGKVYYLHLGYTCDQQVQNPGSASSITIKVNDISVLTEEDEEEVKDLENGNNSAPGTGEENYHFEKTDDGYVPNNLTTTNSKAISYLPVDLSDKKGKYSIKIDVTSRNKGKLNAYLTTEKQEPNGEEPFYTSSGEGKESCFSPILEGGEQYYICFIFTSADTQDEKTIAINEITTVHEEIYVVEETNENGQIVIEVPEGEYKITEIKAPDGYELDKNSQTCKIGEGNKNTADFTNSKLKEVIIHYYEKGTGKENNQEPVELKEDVHIYGENGSEYNTISHIEYELEGGYTLEVDKENEYVIPENVTGHFGNEPIDVYYYYEKINNRLINISAKKQWQMPEEEANNYRATLKLVSIVNGNSVPAVDNNGDEITRVIQGNGSAVFKDVKQYEDGLKLEYKVQEVKIEKLESINTETQEEVWVEVPLNQFRVMYGIEE